MVARGSKKLSSAVLSFPKINPHFYNPHTNTFLCTNQSDDHDNALVGDFCSATEYLSVVKSLQKISSEAKTWKSFVNHEILKYLPTKETFLDVGVGNGELTAYLLPYFQRAHVIDSSLEALNSLPPVYTSLQKHQGKIELFFPGSLQFDFINFSHVLYYVAPSHLPHIFSRFIRCLKSQGKFLITITESLDKQNLIETFSHRHFNLEVIILAALKGLKLPLKIDVFYAKETLASLQLDEIYDIGRLYLYDAQIQTSSNNLKNFLLTTCKRENNTYVFNVIQKFIVISL